jgi:hypothetical protein
VEYIFGPFSVDIALRPYIGEDPFFVKNAEGRRNAFSADVYAANI